MPDNTKDNAGLRFRAAIANNSPLQIIGTMNAYFAKMAEQSGVQAIYLSGAGVANASFGVPDLAITTMNDVLIDAQRITSATELPLLVDIDTGWGGAFNIARSIKAFESAGVAAVHIEDQVSQKRCGHRPNKALVNKQEMVDRIKAAVDARTNSDFVIMARTDAATDEGIDSAIERAQAYIEAGADMIFAEALTQLDEYRQFKAQVKAPLLANMTEFGKTELFDKNQLANLGVDMILYPLSTFRAANQAGLEVMQAIIKDGHQRNVVDKMQSRSELYEFLNYHQFEQKLDKLFKQ